MEQFIEFMKNYWWILLIALLVIIIAIVGVVLALKNKKPKIKIDDTFINNLIALYGGEGNISSINVDNGRLKIEVKDLELVNLEGIKGVAEAGVFVTGNIIKTLYKLDSLAIKNALQKRI